MERKLELERIYKEYCSSGIEHLKEDYQVDYEFFSRLVEFRLSVSGGSESTMGDIGMNFISGFLDEIFLFNDMMDDCAGCYRGEFWRENFEGLKEILDESSLEETDKKEILDGFKERYEMDDDIG